MFKINLINNGCNFIFWVKKYYNYTIIYDKIYENWFTEEIGNGYKGTKIKEENQKDYRFHDHLKKNS